MLDDAGKIHPAMAGGVERLVDLLRMLAERRRGARRPWPHPAPASGPSPSAPRQSPACSRCWRARSAPGPAPGNRTSATSTAPTRSRRRRTAPDATGRAFRPAQRPRRPPIMEMPRIMLLQILAACPAPAPPQCTIFLPIFSSTGFAAANALSSPPHMKVSVAPLAPPVPPDTGASTESDAVLGGQRMRLLGAFDVDGRAIDDQRALGHRGNDLVPDRQHMLARRQHGDDDIGALHRRRPSSRRSQRRRPWPDRARPRPDRTRSPCGRP